MKDQINRRLKSMAIETRRHRLIERVIRILPVHDFRHFPERVHDKLARHDPLMQPIGDVLA